MEFSTPMQLPARIGKYELQEFLGGGMSHVYRAIDTVIGRTVAVKILTDAGCQDAEAKERFLAEARRIRAGHAVLHGAAAGDRREHHRSGGYLRVRYLAVRTADRKEAHHRRRRGAHLLQHSERAAETGAAA